MNRILLILTLVGLGLSQTELSARKLIPHGKRPVSKRQEELATKQPTPEQRPVVTQPETPKPTPVKQPTQKVARAPQTWPEVLMSIVGQSPWLDTLSKMKQQKLIQLKISNCTEQNLNYARQHLMWKANGEPGPLVEYAAKMINDEIEKEMKRGWISKAANAIGKWFGRLVNGIPQDLHQQFELMFETIKATYMQSRPATEGATINKALGPNFKTALEKTLTQRVGSKCWSDLRTIASQMVQQQKSPLKKPGAK